MVQYAIYNEWLSVEELVRRCWSWYYHSYRDKENMYPFYAAGRYTFRNVKIKPYIGFRAGIMYDPLWIEKVQKYGALSAGVSVYKG